MLKKTAISLITVALFALPWSGAIAATAKCTVKEIKDEVVILDCGKTAGKLKAGNVVKIKTAKKMIEGC